MITIFTVPKAFEGFFDTIQRNAILSWKKLRPEPEIILFGLESGVAKTAAEFTVRHIPEIEKNELGTPLVNSAFELARKIAQNNLLVYADCDVILMNDLISAIKLVKLPIFLMASQRWNLEIKNPIRFQDSDWEEKLRNRLVKEGELASPAAMDYFAFPRNLKVDFPNFIIGRQAWDDWFLYKVRSLGVPMIDATKMVIAIHQKHDYSHLKRVGQYNLETKKSIDLLGGFHRTFTLRDADWILTSQGLKKRRFFSLKSRAGYRYLTSFLNTYPYFDPGLKLLFFPAWLVTSIAKKIRRLFLKLIKK